MIGSKIEHIRKNLNMTQLDLAAKSNLSQAAISQIERNCRGAMVGTIEAIADALGVDVKDISGEPSELVKLNANIKNLKASQIKALNEVAKEMGKI